MNNERPKPSDLCVDCPGRACFDLPEGAEATVAVLACSRIRKAMRGKNELPRDWANAIQNKMIRVGEASDILAEHPEMIWAMVSCGIGKCALENATGESSEEIAK